MTEHSLEERKRQMDLAVSIARQAGLDEAAAKKQYHDARCRKTGLIGKLASNSRFTILIQDIRFFDSRTDDQPWFFTGFKLKKNGMPGEQSGTVWQNDCKISEYLSAETGAPV